MTDLTTKAQLEKRLREAASPERAAGHARFFQTGPGAYGEGDRFLGVTVPDIRAIVRDAEGVTVPQVRGLLSSPWHEVRLLALLVLVRRYERGDATTRTAIYRLYLQSTRHINNWDLVDSSAPQIVGAHLFERSRAPLAKLARSASLWERRIAIIATLYFIRRGDYGDTLRTAGLLVHDSEDLIHKAVGWMLREVGNRSRATVETFLSAHAATMPRTMLRYALERFPPPLRKRYMGMRQGASQ